MTDRSEDARERGRFLAVRTHCPLCGETNVDYEFVLDRTAYSLCHDCDLLFASRNGLAPDSLPADATPRAVLEHGLDLAERYLGRRPSRALCVGRSCEQTKHVTTCGLADLQRLSPASFDAVVAIGVVEAADDPEATLSLLRRCLEKGGALVVMFASTTSLASRTERSNWRPLRGPGRYFFSPDNLQLLATRCDFGDFLIYTQANESRSAPGGRAVEAWYRSGAVLTCRAGRLSDHRLLSVIMPVYNEQATLERSLRRVLAKEIPGIALEVIVVENNSTDGSGAILEAFRFDPRVTIVQLERPRGKGHAVRAGLSLARGEVVLIQDADLEYDVEDYDRLVAPLFALQKNFVLGSRHNARGQGWKVRYFDSEPALTAVMNLGQLALVFLFNRLYQQRLRDPFTMYKVFRRDCLYGLEFECERFDFDLELVIKLLRKGYQVTEIAVNYRSRSFREGKKISFFGDPPDWIRTMLKYRKAPVYRL